MNCKPDQICRVLSGPNAQALVRTKHRCGCASDKFEAMSGRGGMWTCEALQHMDTGEFIPPPGAEGITRVRPGDEVCLVDANLKPLGGEGKDPADVTVKDALTEYIQKETKRIIPIVKEPA